MLASFAATKISPPRVRCLGVEMLPYSLGHHLRLLAVGSPFVSGGMPGREALICAAIVCSHNWSENEKLQRSKLRRWLWLKVWGLLVGEFDVFSEKGELDAHIRNAQRFPDQRPPQRGTQMRHLFSDYETRLYLFLRASGFTEAEAMDMPLAQANLLFASRLEEDGKVDLKSKLDFATDDALTRACEEAEAAEKSMSA